MKNYERYENERFNNILPIEKKQEIINKSNAIIEKMKEYIGKKITIYYQCSGGGFWELKEFKKIEFKEHNFNDGITILDCYIYGIPNMKEFIKKNKKDLIIDNTPELIKSKIYDENVEILQLQWQDKNKIGKRVNE